MPHDPARVQDTRAWLTKALMDLRAADHLLQAHPPLRGSAVFHSQQAAEKALKAFLAWHDEPFRRTHNLEELGQQAAALDATLQPVVYRAGWLTEYAWKFRYPGEPEEPSPEEAGEARALAHEVYAAVLARLPEEARP